MEDFRTRRLSLHQVTARDASPGEIVRIAAALGCAHVCLFTQRPAALASPFPVVEDHEAGELRRLMDGLGVSLLSATSFTLTPEVDVGAFDEGLALAERLGGGVANVRILDNDLARSIDNFGALAELARRQGLDASIEFTGYDIPHILGWTLEVIRQAGRGKVSLDPLHIARTGVPIEALRRLDPGMIGYVQLCDGPLKATREDYAREGAYDRLPPCAGEFPLLGLLDATPPGFPLALEAPQERLLQQGVSAMERARQAVDGARRLLDEASRVPS